MSDFVLSPTPLKAALGTGFWVDLQQNLLIAIAVLEANTEADISATSSDDGEHAFDPTENTVTELMTGIASIIDNKY